MPLTAADCSGCCSNGGGVGLGWAVYAAALARAVLVSVLITGCAHGEQAVSGEGSSSTRVCRREWRGRNDPTFAGHLLKHIVFVFVLFLIQKKKKKTKKEKTKQENIAV